MRRSNLGNHSHPEGQAFLWAADQSEKKKGLGSFLLTVFSVWEYMGSRHRIYVEVRGQLADVGSQVVRLGGKCL